MSVLMTKDKKEIVVTCNCGCHNSFHILIDDDDKDWGQYAFMCFLKGNEKTERRLMLHYWYVDEVEDDHGISFICAHGIVSGHKRLMNNHANQCNPNNSASKSK